MVKRIPLVFGRWITDTSVHHPPPPATPSHPTTSGECTGLHRQEPARVEAVRRRYCLTQDVTVLSLSSV